jgi:hypothetical protein
VTIDRLSGRRAGSYRHCHDNAHRRRLMNRLLIRGVTALCIGLSLAGCATTQPQEISILDAMAARSANQPLSCAAMNAATVCVKSMRLDRNQKCECADRSSLANGSFRGF